jgi:hypothetical protein
MKVVGFFLFLILLVAKSKAKYVEGHIKTLEVSFPLHKTAQLFTVHSRAGLGLCLALLLLVGIGTLRVLYRIRKEIWRPAATLILRRATSVAFGVQNIKSES